METLNREQWSVAVKPNPFADNFMLVVPQAYQKDVLEIRISDILGRHLLYTKGRIDEVNQAIRQWLHQGVSLNNSIYFLGVQSLSRQEQATLKIVKQ